MSSLFERESLDRGDGKIDLLSEAEDVGVQCVRRCRAGKSPMSLSMSASVPVGSVTVPLPVPVSC